MCTKQSENTHVVFFRLHKYLTFVFNYYIYINNIIKNITYSKILTAISSLNITLASLEKAKKILSMGHDLLQILILFVAIKIW
jgi:hypothetical protein